MKSDFMIKKYEEWFHDKARREPRLTLLYTAYKAIVSLLFQAEEPSGRAKEAARA